MKLEKQYIFETTLDVRDYEVDFQGKTLYSRGNYKSFD